MTSRPRWIVRVPGSREPERAYIIGLVLGSWLGLDHDVQPHDGTDVELLLAGEPDGWRLRVPDLVLATDEAAWLTEQGMPSQPFETLRVPGPGMWQDVLPAGFPAVPGPTAIPQVYGRGSANDLAVHQLDDGLALAIDIFGSVFFMVTRYEELVRTRRDAYGRFPAGDGVLVANGLAERPIVDEYVDLLHAAMRTLWPWMEPRANDHVLRLSHDVDQPWAAWRRPLASMMRSMLGDVVKRRHLSLAFLRARALVDRRSGRLDRDPYDTFDALMDVGERHGLPTTFYFLAGNRPGDDDFRYAEVDAPVLALLRRIARRGHEVGLHGSHLSYRNPSRLAFEAQALRDVAAQAGFKQEGWGIRQHFLRFDMPYTWRDQQSAGFDLDSTLGYAEMPGFRSGTGRDHHVFDLLARKPMTLIERPLLVMDVTLFDYLGLSRDEAFDRVVRIVERCRLHGSPATVLFHNNSLPAFGIEDWYRDLVATLSDGG